MSDLIPGLTDLSTEVANHEQLVRYVFEKLNPLSAGMDGIALTNQPRNKSELKLLSGGKVLLVESQVPVYNFNGNVLLLTLNLTNIDFEIAQRDIPELYDIFKFLNIVDNIDLIPIIPMDSTLNWKVKVTIPITNNPKYHEFITAPFDPAKLILELEVNSEDYSKDIIKIEVSCQKGVGEDIPDIKLATELPKVRNSEDSILGSRIEDLLKPIESKLEDPTFKQTDEYKKLLASFSKSLKSIINIAAESISKT
jgi:hypothetical protein